MEQRSLPADGWFKRCTAPDGTTTRLVRECSEPSCKKSGNVVLERIDAVGDFVGAPRRVNDIPASMHSYRMSCHSNGRFVVQWKDYFVRCYRHRVYDADGRPLSDSVMTIDETDDCRVRPSIAVQADGGFVAAWLDSSASSSTKILARRYRRNGSTAMATRTMSAELLGGHGTPKLAVDDTGTVLVAWAHSVGGGARREILASALLAGASAPAAVIRLDSFGHGQLSDPVVEMVSDSVFEVTWSNPLQGGRVARLVATDPTLAPTAPLAVEPLPSGATQLPRFGAARVVDSAEAPQLQSHPHRLYSGASGHWLLSDHAGSLQITADDGAHWMPPAMHVAAAVGHAVLAGNGLDEWALLWVDHAASELEVQRSHDGGRSWQSDARFAINGAAQADGRTCEVGGLDLAATLDAASGQTGWIAAWGSTCAAPEDSAEADPHTSLWVTSRPVGATRWRQPNNAGEALGAGTRGFRLAVSNGGTAVLAWADTDLWASRSTNAGATWSKNTLVAADVLCASCRLHRRYDRIDLASPIVGTWLLAFASPQFNAETTGHDADLFLARSTDDGLDWWAPSAVLADAGSDAVRDLDPSMAVDADGTTLLAWTSYRALGAGDNLDSDVLITASTDAGRNWLPPTRLSSESVEIDSAESDPQLARDTAGVWMAVWQQIPLAPADGLLLDRVVVAASPAVCGNAVREAGEACDDGNRANDDGCDADCSETGCGNAIVNVGEACDDGNASNDDHCVITCEKQGCGDGFLHPTDEQCDDGNLIDGDGCSGECGLPVCGDGIVDMPEECDDGNGKSDDECTAQCRLAFCGDGIVWRGVEACDDGNTTDGDGCAADCSPVCGDGRTDAGFEECDFGDAGYRGLCSDECKFRSVCGDPDGDGIVSASDALRILRHSVGYRLKCGTEFCDLDGNRLVNSSDGLIALNFAVGARGKVDCRLGPINVVFTLETAVELGALQADIDYSASGGEFKGFGANVACERLTEELSAFNDDDREQVLSWGVANTNGFQGPIDMVRCTFFPAGPLTELVFDVTVTDASDLDSRPQSARVGYRLEGWQQGPSQ